MSDKLGPLDLAAFFDLSEDEVRGLGLEAGQSRTDTGSLRSAAQTGTGSLREQARLSAADLLSGPQVPTDLALAEVLADGVLGDTDQLVPFGNRTDDHDEPPGIFTPSPPSPDTDSPDRQHGEPDQEAYSWPTEAEMLAAGPAPDPDFTPEDGVASWVAPATQPTPRGSAEDAGVPDAWLAPRMPSMRSRAAPDGAAPTGSADPAAHAPSDPEARAHPHHAAFVADRSLGGRGPYGLTEEQLAELGPDTLRDLDLAMTATLPRIVPVARPDDLPFEGAVAEAPVLSDALSVPSPIPEPPPPASDEVAMPSALLNDLLEVFKEEAVEMLDSLHASLETLEQGSSLDAVIEARRTVHTIKGGARMCGMPALTDLAHACEDMIGPANSGATSLAPDMIALLFQAEQEMRAALSAPASGAGSGDSMRSLAARLRGAPASGAATGANGASAQAVRPAEDATGARDGSRPTPSGPPSSLLRATGPGSSLLRRPVITSVSSQGNRLAVDLTKVEGMVAKVTEIVANRAASHGLMETLSSTVTESMRTVHRLQSIATQLQYQIVSQGLDITADHDPNGLALETYGPLRQLLLQLQEAVADQQALVQGTMDIVTNKRALAAVETRLDTDLQGALLNMRLLPLSQLRVRLDQVVRSAAAAAGREVRWVMEGQNVALDKHVCDKLFEPLMHLLRNAIDHGIEPPDEREANGKPRVGRIVVHAAVEGNQALVSVSDDGAGMDPVRIAAVAVARGVISEAQAHTLSDREKLELVFRPGFSTAKAITELSGRGMGMEIVREACTRMGGTVTIAPRLGGGTVITLQVPLSMSVVHALIVRDGGRLLAIPASQVLSVHLVRPVAVSTRPHGQTVRMGREELPLYRLPGGVAQGRRTAPAPAEFSVIAVPFRGGRVAIAVDEMVNEEDLIVKPLPLLLQGIDRLLGAVILSDGVPAPVLNLGPLLDQVVQHGAEIAPPTSPASAEQVVLVVDDSLTMRVALTQTLGHAGYTVLAARDGQEALDLIRAHGMPQLVTLDIEMPRMDGLETLYAIRHTPGGEAVPVFMLTSRTGQKHKRTAIQLGATRYFSKPYHDREFLRAVQEAIAMLRTAG